MSPVSIASGAVSRSNSYPSDRSSGVELRARLDRYQKQLSDCVNCASAKTPKGKADIAAITSKIDETKRAMTESEDQGQARQPVKDAQAGANPASYPLGSRIDVFA